MLRCLMVVKFSNAMAKKTSKQFQSFLFISLEFDFEQFRLFERLEFADSKQMWHIHHKYDCLLVTVDRIASACNQHWARQSHLAKFQLSGMARH